MVGMMEMADRDAPWDLLSRSTPDKWGNEEIEACRSYCYDVARKAGLQYADAEDVAQEAIIKVLTQYGTFRSLGQAASFKAWVTKIATNERYKELRGQVRRGSLMVQIKTSLEQVAGHLKRVVQPDQAVTIDDGGIVFGKADDALVNFEDYQLLRTAYEQLSKDDRTVVDIVAGPFDDMDVSRERSDPWPVGILQLRDFLGTKLPNRRAKDLADVLRLSEDAARKRIQRARERLRKNMSGGE